MLIKNRWVSDKTMLKLIAQILRKFPLSKGYKITTEQGVEKILSEEVIQFTEDLAEAFYKGDYGEINRCKTCGNFDPSYCGRGRGWCSEFVGYHTARDFCSSWIPQTEQKRELIRRITIDENRKELEKLQAKRAGNVSKDSIKGNRPTSGTKAKRRSGSE